MTHAKFLRLAAALFALAVLNVSCSTQASKAEYFGKTEPLPDQYLRYISGSETESLDPQVGTSQPDARIYMSMYDGLTEYFQSLRAAFDDRSIRRGIVVAEGAFIACQTWIEGPSRGRSPIHPRGHWNRRGAASSWTS